MISYVLGQVKKKTHVSRPDFYKKESGRAVFFVIYCFLWHAFFTHHYLSPRDTLELLGQILRTFARIFSNLDFFLKILPLKDDELAMSEM